MEAQQREEIVAATLTAGASVNDGKASCCIESRQQWSWQLRIELLGVTPTVWRLIVPESIKLPKLHKVFQTALGWTNSHLHEFHICGKKFSDSDPDFLIHCSDGANACAPEDVGGTRGSSLCYAGRRPIRPQTIRSGRNESGA